MHTRWRRLSTEQLRELWRLWKEGQTLGAIGRAIERPLDSVYSVVRRHGGIPPRERTRHPRVLSVAEREEISRGIAAAVSIRAIAQTLGRSVARFVGMAAGLRIARAEPTTARGSGRPAPSGVGWRPTGACDTWWPQSCAPTGHPSRSRSGSC